MAAIIIYGLGKDNEYIASCARLCARGRTTSSTLRRSARAIITKRPPRLYTDLSLLTANRDIGSRMSTKSFVRGAGVTKGINPGNKSNRTKDFIDIRANIAVCRQQRQIRVQRARLFSL